MFARHFVQILPSFSTQGQTDFDYTRHVTDELFNFAAEKAFKGLADKFENIVKLFVSAVKSFIEKNRNKFRDEFELQ